MARAFPDVVRELLQNACGESTATSARPVRKRQRMSAAQRKPSANGCGSTGRHVAANPARPDDSPGGLTPSGASVQPTNSSSAHPTSRRSSQMGDDRRELASSAFRRLRVGMRSRPHHRAFLSLGLRVDRVGSHCARRV